MKTLLFLCLFITPYLFLNAEPSSDHKALASAAQHAVASGNTDLLSALLKAGLQINEPIDENGHTALHWSAVYNKLRSARFLMKNGADPHARNKHGNRPIDEAFNDNQLEMCKTLAVGTDDDYIIDDIIPNEAVETLLAGWSKETNLVFVAINQKDPGNDIDGWLDYKWSNWKPYSDAIELTENAFYDEKAPSMHKSKSTGKYGKLISINFKKISKDKYEYQFSRHTGSLAASGSRGIILRKYGYWIIIEETSWIS